MDLIARTSGDVYCQRDGRITSASSGLHRSWRRSAALRRTTSCF